ncbi:MAG: D-aminoacylase [Chloroflexota bacterium]|nr:D-aminoacylase [Dehalococcoidia bacterium]MDW8254439.1 D-aminoacylase [Chloroflexota bacterium]
MVDLLITGGLVLDGTGTPAQRCDVAVSGDRIAAIGTAPERAAAVLDATGCVVAPGFIDVHGHSDSALFLNRAMESKVRQGITTEVLGNCGASLAPLAGPAVALTAAELDRLGVSLRWRSVGEYLSAVEAEGVAINIAMLVGHDALRHSVIGAAARPADAAEIRAMQRLLDRSLREGAIGLSTGLAYTPGAFASPAEITALAQVVAGRGIYATHLRDEGRGLRAAIDEAVTTARTSGARLQISHLKASGALQRGTLAATLAWLDALRASGVDLGWDVYPYTAASTLLAATLPPWLHDGGPDALLARLRDPAVRPRIRAAFEEGGWPSLALDAGWEGIVITGARGRPDAAGRSVAALAAASGRHPLDEVIDLLLAAEGMVGAIFHVLSDDDVAAAIAHPWTVFGTDSAARAPQGRLGRGQPHPRGYGTFPRLLKGRSLREMAALIPRMTSMPARRFGLRDRGVLAPGAFADLVIFDPAAISDRATYEHPHRFPVGVQWVIVNGRVVVAPEGQRAVLPGRVLRGS